MVLKNDAIKLFLSSLIINTIFYLIREYNKNDQNSIPLIKVAKKFLLYYPFSLLIVLIGYVLYKGVANINNVRFTYRLITPKDINEIRNPLKSSANITNLYTVVPSYRKSNLSITTPNVNVTPPNVNVTPRQM